MSGLQCNKPPDVGEDPPAVQRDRIRDRSYRNAPVRTRQLPASIVNETGLISAAARGRFAELRHKRNGQDRVLELDDGSVARTPAGQVMKSTNGVAEDLWRRFYKRPLPDTDHPLQNSDFKRFYKRVWGILDRDDRLEKAGSPVEGPFSDWYGRNWKLGRWASGQPEGAEPLDVVRPAINPEERALVGNVDVGALAEEVIAHEEQLHEEFAYTVGHAEHGTTRRTVKGQSWEQRKARSADDRQWYRSVGQWHKQTAGNRGAYVTVPWLIADLDEETREENLEVARQLVRRCRAHGIDPERVVVCYTGGRGFHVRVPHSVIGCPIYRNAEVATREVRKFWRTICGEDEELFGAIDPSCFSPLQDVRAIGSVHQDFDGSASSDYRTRYCTGFTGRDILDHHATYIFALAEGPDRSNKRRPRDAGYYAPFTVPDPSSGSAITSLIRVVSSPAGSPPPVTTHCSNGENRGVIDRLRNGVAEAENWAEGIDYEGCGRNKAAWTYALYLLTSRDPPDDPWKTLTNWNEKNAPALPAGELRTCYASAKRCAASYRYN